MIMFHDLWLRILYRLRKKLALFHLKEKQREMRMKLTNSEFSLFCSNCIAGVVYHDLGLQFQSPTINLYIPADDFVRFISNLEHYLNLELVELNSPNPYPVAKLGDIKIFFVHYHSFSDAKAKWEERCKRVNLDNVKVIMVDRDEFEPMLLNDFDEIGYDKIFLSSRDYKRNYNIVSSPFKGERYLGAITQYYNARAVRNYEVDFDMVEWLNTGDILKRVQ